MGGLAPADSHSGGHGPPPITADRVSVPGRPQRCAPDFPFREPEHADDPWIAANAGDILGHLPVPIVLIAGQAPPVCLDPQTCAHRFHAGYHTGIRGLEGAKGKEAKRAGIEGQVVVAPALWIISELPHEPPMLVTE